MSNQLCVFFILITLFNVRIASGNGEFERIENHGKIELEATYFAVQKNLDTVKRQLVRKRKQFRRERDPVMRTALEEQILLLEEERARLKQARDNLYQSFGHDEYELVYEIANNWSASPN